MTETVEPLVIPNRSKYSTGTVKKQNGGENPAPRKRRRVKTGIQAETQRQMVKRLLANGKSRFEEVSE